MPRYTINHVLTSPGTTETEGETKVFRPGTADNPTVVTDKDLIDAGFDGEDGRRSIASLLKPPMPGVPGAISIVKGTEDITAEVEADIRKRMAPAKSKAPVVDEAV